MGKGIGCLTGALLALLGAAPATAAEPSFDCTAAGGAMERLICADGGLATLDAALAEAFAARKAAKPEAAKRLTQEQRAWIAARDRACPAPTVAADEEPAPAAVWAAAPCVAGQYRARLAALGAAPPPTDRLPAGEVHPLCVLTAVLLADAGEAEGVALEDCTAGTAHVPLTVEDGFVAVPGAALAPFGLAYGATHRVGTLPDGRALVQTAFTLGGTGWFGDLVAVAEDRGRLRTEVVWAGGDRCNGGLDTAELDGDRLRVTTALTPAALLDLGRPDGGQDDPPPSAVPDCASCCVGTMTAERALDPAAPVRLTAVAVDGADDTPFLDDPDDAAARCFGDALAAAAPTRPAALKRPALAALVERFDACMAQTAAAPSDSCAFLTRVAEAGATRFEPIAGAWNSDWEAYVATETLAGAEVCGIAADVGADAAYFCDVGDLASAEEAEARAAALAEAVRGCFAGARETLEPVAAEENEFYRATSPGRHAFLLPGGGVRMAVRSVTHLDRASGTSYHRMSFCAATTRAPDAGDLCP
ncbi:lysozyme inhibitor LprI family protein [Caenispirillum bisanense]|uniref:Uncharacterized conserved protein YecT, DUF1311 family n=1 Tax=Caenispirillum bisanense TaxID=414052 RepID=A0A286GJN4_9PROT|nr:lysozyme inhibitor LprI family protein [Caenispirillum bisanense]SOD95426.1 Uncharacterized conserved protein YecT, DUF1311 family [Caenispirillum bisanense]